MVKCDIKEPEWCADKCDVGKGADTETLVIVQETKIKNNVSHHTLKKKTEMVKLVIGMEVVAHTREHIKTLKDVLVKNVNLKHLNGVPVNVI